MSLPEISRCTHVPCHGRILSTAELLSCRNIRVITSLVVATIAATTIRRQHFHYTRTSRVFTCSNNLLLRAGKRAPRLQIQATVLVRQMLQRGIRQIRFGWCRRLPCSHAQNSAIREPLLPISKRAVLSSRLVFAPAQVHFLKAKTYLPAFLIPLQSLGFRGFLDHSRHVSVLGDAANLR